MDEKISAILRKLEQVPERGHTFWNVPPETGKFLNILTGAVNARKVLEVGTSNGYSGLWFAEALSHTGGKLYTVESHRERFELARQHFGEAGVTEWVQQVPGHAPEVFAQQEFSGIFLADSFDLIFLDATKMEYASYVEAVLPLLKKGGVLLADNVISHAGELGDFLAKVQEKKELSAVTLPLGSGVLMALRS